MEEDKLPRAQLRDGRLYIEGEKEPYVQATRHLFLTVRTLQYQRTFDIDECKVRQGGRVRGTAAIERDTLTVAGSGLPKVNEIPFSMRAVPEEETKYHWQMSVGFLPHDWEIGTDDEYYCECYAPEPVFNEPVKAYLTGKAEELTINTDTKLWVNHLDLHTPLGHGVTLHLVPSTRRQSNMPDQALGKITHFSWAGGPMERPPAVQGAVTSTPVIDEEAYRAEHVAMLGKISRWLFAIFVTLIILATILLLNR